MANRNYLSNKLYQLEAYPVLLSCNFIVDATNGNGYGVRSLKGPGFKNVYMNTSASMTGTVVSTSFNITAIAAGTSSLRVGMPVQGTGIPAGTTITAILSSSSVAMSASATGSHSSESITYQAPGSPNPAAGVIQVQLQDNYYKYLGGFYGFVSPLSGTPLTSATANVAYTIVSLGTATAAQWATAGVPVGVTPAVGVNFIAAATGTIGGSAAVEVVKSTGSGIDHIEGMGDPSQTLNLGNSMVNGGSIFIANCWFEGAVTAPANGTVISLSYYLSNSSVTVQGQ